MNGYSKLMSAVMKDCKEGRDCFNQKVCDKNSGCSHRYCDKFKWVIERAKHYAEKMGLNWEDVLDSWEESRNYWYMNYYQECNQPLINSDRVRVFDTLDELTDSFQGKGFVCPMCSGISSNPYTCNSGLEMSAGKTCDWKVGGLFGDLGKGIFVYCKEKLRGNTIFMPVAWKEDDAK